MIATLPPQRPNSPKGGGIAFLPRYNDSVRAMAASKGAQVVDVASLPLSMIGQDGLHPTEAGYARIAELPPLPCAVIQATGDNYLPAASAQRRFGSDTPLRRFYRIDASNHRFSGGTAAFNVALADAIGWMAAPAANPAEATVR